MRAIDIHAHLIPRGLWKSGIGALLEVSHLDGKPIAVGAQGREFGPVNDELLRVERQVEDLEAKNLDLRILSPPPYLFRYNLSPKEAVDWTRRTNESLAVDVSQYADRFLQLAIVPMQDGEFAAAELEYAVKELGVAGVEIGTNIVGRELEHARLEPFWAMAAELDTFVFVHPTNVRGPHFSDEYYVRSLVGNPTETAVAAVRLMFSGLLERFPNLRICLAHGGGSLPFILGRVKQGFACRPECRVHTTTPVDSLVRRFYYDTVVFDPATLAFLGGQVGLDRIVMGTDFPFEISIRDPVSLVESGLGADATMITTSTASALLKLSL